VILLSDLESPAQWGPTSSRHSRIRASNVFGYLAQTGEGGLAEGWRAEGREVPTHLLFSAALFESSPPSLRRAALDNGPLVLFGRE
jgi:hypothetical protein